jgi:DNA-binding NtrC family response regulator
MDTGRTILVAATNQRLGESIQALLQHHQFQASIAKNCDQLLESLSLQEFDLLLFGPGFLVDLPLLQLQLVVKSISPKSKIILLSTNDSIDEFEAQALSRYLHYQKVSLEPSSFIQYLDDEFNALS